MHSSFPARIALLLVLPAASLVLAACAVGPTYTQPAPAVDNTWQTVLPHDGNAGTMHDWWRQFDDPTVAQLVAQADENSPGLIKASAEIDKARATLATARASGLPTLDGSASLFRARQQSTSGTLAVQTTRAAGLDAAWEIDLFSKVRRNTEAAEARTQARVTDWHDARVSLAAEVADTYVQYRGCELLVDAYERERTSKADTEKATAAAVLAGFNAPSDGALARASLASTASTLLSQRAQCDLLVKSLVDLTGRDEPALRTVLSVRAAVGNGLPAPAGLQVQSVPANALRQRPDLASLERELAASSAEIGAAQADLYPSLSLSGSISVSATPGTSALSTWSFGPSLSIPLFDGGRRRAAVAIAEASYRAARADLQQGVRTAVKEVERALVNLDSTARRVREAERADDNYRQYFQATQTNWRAGLESLLTLEEARRSALSAEIDLITLRRDRVEYWIALYKALGGGWQLHAAGPSPDAMTEASRTNR